jgi:hypothetical protein
MTANNLVETDVWKTDVFEIYRTVRPGYECFETEPSGMLDNVFKFWNQTILMQFLSVTYKHITLPLK